MDLAKTPVLVIGARLSFSLILNLSIMLQLSATLINKPIMSLRTSDEIGRATVPIINPNNLKVEGLYCKDRFSNKTMVLVYQDIREFLPKGFIVNDHDSLSDPADLLRLKDVMGINYSLIGKQVVTVSKKRIGKISDYAVDSESMFIQKLYVSQSVFKSFTQGNLSIDRSQVQEVTDTKVIIYDLEASSTATAPATAT